MKTSRSLLIWATLALCGVMVLAAMTWLTRGVLASEKERAIAEARADLEERTRLGLWRMDALGSSIILRENSHGPHDYSIFSRAFRDASAAEVWLHFEVAKDGTLNSPEHWDAVHVKIGNSEAQPHSPTLEGIVVGGQLKRLREVLRANPLPGDEWTLLKSAALEGENAWQSIRKEAPEEKDANSSQRGVSQGDELRKSSAYQTNSNSSERAQRAKALAQAVDNAIPQSEVSEAGPAKENPPAGVGSQKHGLWVTHQSAVDIGQMRPVWLGGELFLLRQTVWNVYQSNNLDPSITSPVKQEVSIEGVWMKIPELKKTLLNEVHDLLPQAKLVQVEGKQAAEDPLALVSFPFRLERNESVNSQDPSWNVPLIVGWLAVLLALLTASLLVHGVMRLSERRASFVSAVTHELRTPLTTFRLYSDMLESGAVKPEKRGDYLRVLSREADRLSHLVENVLAFSKIERGSARASVRELAVADLLAPMRERLEARLATAGLALEMDLETPAAATLVKVDSAAVEHILFNLIDNAAKYASSGDPPLVEIRANAGPNGVEILVTDHGPGIPPAERGRIFRAFHKSAREAAESKPGVGLGLALSRRLAREQGGELECGGLDRGACFILRLPRV